MHMPVLKNVCELILVEPRIMDAVIHFFRLEQDSVIKEISLLCGGIILIVAVGEFVRFLSAVEFIIGFSMYAS